MPLSTARGIQTGRGREGAAGHLPRDAEPEVATDAPALLERTELAPRAPLSGVLASLAHLTDAHVLDAQSPARASFLDRLGGPFTSTFRLQETLTAQVLNGAVRAINAHAPDAVIQGGDLIDNAQANELEQALAVLAGGCVRRVSGGGPYVGVQAATNPDPSYYRPEIDAPHHPGLLELALAAFSAPGLRAPSHPVLGDHDILVAGVLTPSAATQAIALGDRAVWELPTGPDVQRVAAAAMAAPDGLGDPAVIDRLIAELMQVPSHVVPADARRRQLSVAETLAGLRRASGAREDSSTQLDYHFDVGPQVRVIVLDLVRRGGGSDGLVHPGQPAWLADQLRAAGERWVIVVSHHPLDSSQGGPALLSLLDRHPRTLAALWGHIHRNQIAPRPAANGGYWLIATSSLIDYPQQARALRVRATDGGGAALETWMLDHDSAPGSAGEISRQLSVLDLQGGRAQELAGGALDCNVRLYRKPPVG